MFASQYGLHLYHLFKALYNLPHVPPTHTHTSGSEPSMQGLIIRGTGVSAQGHSDVKNRRNRGFGPPAL